MQKEPVAWVEADDVWFYGGIRSVGKYVAVIDDEKQPRELYLAAPSRRKMREWLREEFEDSFAIVPLDFPNNGRRTIS